MLQLRTALTAAVHSLASDMGLSLTKQCFGDYTKNRATRYEASQEEQLKAEEKLETYLGMHV